MMSDAAKSPPSVKSIGARAVKFAVIFVLVGKAAEDWVRSTASWCK